MANIIDGKAVSAQVKEDIRIETEKLKAQGIEIGLAVVIVGNDPASQVYVRNKEKACEAVGFNSYKYALPEKTTEQELLALVDKLNNDDKVDGILVQLPLPKHLDDKVIINNILPEKDVDAFHPVNVGKIMIGDYSFLPCTPAGVMELIKSTGTEISGKNCVVIGRSNIVGKPQAMLLLHQSGTVTICHSKTKDLKKICSEADILVVAVGKPKIIDADYIKEGAVVIDVGMDRDENGKLCGDVDFESCKEKAGYITPVPGGVGPMTIAMLMKNTLTAAKMHKGLLGEAPEPAPDTKERSAWNKIMLHT
ncbi:MAG: bifunctional methylenetetrahydrofolate dehydrogenase/methenyltetrahydrofolate cyclohydrolase FolD [Ruminococcus sp.]|nr:bifunctional methylenetetrahydrofolate dehydrogenase/methenyltetrahydrofolate cyclohydrolase FolD [Ruminococcus sp.]